MGFTEWAALVQTGSTLLVLGWLVWQFYRGKILSRSVVNELLRENEKNVKLLANEIRYGLEKIVAETVKKAIAAGIEEYRRNNGTRQRKWLYSGQKERK